MHLHLHVNAFAIAWPPHNPQPQACGAKGECCAPRRPTPLRSLTSSFKPERMSGARSFLERMLCTSNISDLSISSDQGRPLGWVCASAPPTACMPKRNFHPCQQESA